LRGASKEVDEEVALLANGEHDGVFELAEPGILEPYC